MPPSTSFLETPGTPCLKTFVRHEVLIDHVAEVGNLGRLGRVLLSSTFSLSRFVGIPLACYDHRTLHRMLQSCRGAPMWVLASHGASFVS